MRSVEVGFDEAQPGDIFYSDVLAGGIGHAMIFLGKDANGNRLFKSYFKLLNPSTGKANQILNEQPINGMARSNIKVYRKK